MHDHPNTTADKPCPALRETFLRLVEASEAHATLRRFGDFLMDLVVEANIITMPRRGEDTAGTWTQHQMLVLAHHVGRGRNWNDADLFVSKLAKATNGPFQLTTDGFDGYPDAVRLHLLHRADFAQLIKMYGEDPEGARRYSPGRIIGGRVKYVNRFADPDRVCTSHVERQNLTMRMQIRRPGAEQR